MINLTGQVFERLTIIEEGERTKDKKRQWKCICSCGNKTIVRQELLLKGGTKSCGCLSIELSKKRAIKHGKSHTPIYECWLRMIRRCEEPSFISYPDYGGRGITVCDRWRTSFVNFYADMGERPEGMSIERKDNDGPYSPDNCRWATKEEQNRNKRNNINITINGKTMCLTAWASYLGIHLSILYRRYLKDGKRIDGPFLNQEINKHISSAAYEKARA